MTLAIRADADARIGAGHLMRSIALAEAWRAGGGDVVLFTAAPPPFVARAAERAGVLVRAHQSAVAALDALIGWARANTGAWVAVDSYDLGADAHRSIRAAGARLLVVDDCAPERDIHCDILLNQNLGAETLGYRVGSTTRCCFGPSYALIRDEFRQHPPPRHSDGVAARLVVTFGGADVHDQGRRVSRIVSSARPPLDMVVIAGQAHPGAASVAAPRTGVTIERRAPTDAMGSILPSADLAVCAAGSTCWELAHLGVPALTLVVADNQQRVASALHDAGVVRNLGWFDRVSDEGLASAIDDLRHDTAARAEMSRRGRALVDGRGAERVVETMRLAAVEA